MVKALDSNSAAICQTCSHAARAGPQLYALSDQLTGRDRPRSRLAAGGLVWLGSRSPTLAAPTRSVLVHKCGRGFESHS